MRTFKSKQELQAWLATVAPQGTTPPEDYEIVEDLAELAPPPVLPPWDFYGEGSDKEMIAAYPGKRRVTDMKGETSVQKIVGALVSGKPVPLLKWDTEGLPVKRPIYKWINVSHHTLDPNWDAGECVDWRTESIQEIINSSPWSTSPSIVDIFDRMVKNLKWFIDLPEDEYYDFLALWGIGTYCRPVWDAYGYLHFDSSEEACGKTKAGKVLGRMCFWPVWMNGNSTLPEWRDTSHFGRTQILDDIETQEDMLKRMGALPLLHGGYKRGTPIRLKDKTARGSFKSKVIEPFTSRIIASVWAMPSMLRSRTFQIWMKRTENEALTRHRDWPHDPLVVKDDLYTWTYENMALVKKVYNSSRINALAGRGYEIGGPILALACILEDEGVSGLLSRISTLLGNLESESMDQRAEDNDEYILMQATLAASPNNEEVTAKEVHAQMRFSGLTPKHIGRRLAGANWTTRRKINGIARYQVVDRDKVKQTIAAGGPVALVALSSIRSIK